MLLWTLGCMCPFEFVLFSLNLHPGAEFMYHMVVLVFVFWQKSQILSSTVATPIYISTNSVLGFPFPTSLPTFVICGLCFDSHSDRYKVTSHCGFDLHFSDD